MKSLQFYSLLKHSEESTTQDEVQVTSPRKEPMQNEKPRGIIT